MCGRYLLRNAPEDALLSPWREYWRDINTHFVPRYNIAPSQTAAVARFHQGQIFCEEMAWGFKPNWSKYRPMINARAEGLLESKMFKGAALSKRGLVLADGFYEPKGEKTDKNRPWYLFEKDKSEHFTIAAVWSESGYTIVTSEANEHVSPCHDRMPLIIPEQYREKWLHYKLSEKEIKQLLNMPYKEKLSSFAVSDYVKKASHEGEKCIETPEKPIK